MFQEMLETLELISAINDGRCSVSVQFPSTLSSDDCLRYHAMMEKVVSSSGIIISRSHPHDGIQGRVMSAKGLATLSQNKRYICIITIDETYHGLSDEKGIAALSDSSRAMREIDGTIRGVKSSRTDCHTHSDGMNEKAVCLPVCPSRKTYTWQHGKDGSGFYLRPM